MFLLVLGDDQCTEYLKILCWKGKLRKSLGKKVHNFLFYKYRISHTNKNKFCIHKFNTNEGIVIEFLT